MLGALMHGQNPDVDEVSGAMAPQPGEQSRITLLADEVANAVVVGGAAGVVRHRAGMDCRSVGASKQARLAGRDQGNLAIPCALQLRPPESWTSCDAAALRRGWGVGAPPTPLGPYLLCLRAVRYRDGESLDSPGRPLTSQSSASHCQTRTQSTRSSCG